MRVLRGVSKGVLTQHFIIELRHSLHIERVTLDFTLCLIIVASVPIVFRPTRTKFRNVLTGFKFIGELTEMRRQVDRDDAHRRRNRCRNRGPVYRGVPRPRTTINVPSRS